ncbi:flagellar hook-associated protein FlgK [Methylobacterium sp. SI9]|uniref:flagellar hook-associated protein FlgK n=1 Tax=Methylobacterium guangdongense TaxID=3138811 RepID=UPI00313A84A7
MSLNALTNATAGLAATQAAIGIVSQNVANAGVAGYVKRTISSVATGTNNLGVLSGAVTRNFDAAALKQLRLETSGAAYTATKADVVGQLDKLYGTPGSSTALDGTLNTFTEALQELSANPTSAAARTTVLGNASALAGQINSAASTVQQLRTGVEAQLGADTKTASGLLASIGTLNAKIQNTSDSASLAGLQDQRDQAVNSLSNYMDVQTVAQSDGTVSILTQSGVTLVDRSNAASLSFDGQGSLGVNSIYTSDPKTRTVGTITATLAGGGKIDLGAPGAIRSGSLAAGFELRDQILPQAQRQLDDLAGGLASALTDKTMTGTVTGGSAAIDLSGIQAGNTLTISVKSGATTQNVILIASANASTSVPASQTNDATALVQTFQIPIDPTKYADAVAAALSAIAPNLTATGSSSNITIGPKMGSTDAVVSATAGITVPSSPDPKTAWPQIALFTDGSKNALFTGSFDGGSQLTGFAQRIQVNTALSGNTASLTAAGANDNTASGARAQAIFTALTSTQQTFSSSSGIGGIAAPFSATVAGFAQNVIASQGAASANAATLNDTQQTALSTAQARFSSGAGVNIDEEMSNLIALQNAYGANARVLTAARDMLNQLLQI